MAVSVRRTRNWRRVLLGWFVPSMTLTITAVHFSGRLQDAVGVAVAGIAALLILLP